LVLERPERSFGVPARAWLVLLCGRCTRTRGAGAGAGGAGLGAGGGVGAGSTVSVGAGGAAVLEEPVSGWVLGTVAVFSGAGASAAVLAGGRHKTSTPTPASSRPVDRARGITTALNSPAGS
jgi:hypothetical protein